MPLYQPLVPARYAVPLLEFLREQAPRLVDAVLDDAELAERDIFSPDTALTLTQFDALRGAMSRRLQREDLGFELGRRIRLDQHHQIMGVAMLRCRTGDEMLRLGMRFSRLLIPSFSMRYRRERNVGVMSVRPAADMNQATLYTFEELYALAFHNDYTALLGTRCGIDIHLSMPAPKHVERYRRLRPTRFHFGAFALPEVRAVFDAELLDTPLNPPGSGNAAVSLTELQSRQRDVVEHRVWGDWVRLMLREAEGCQPSREDLAELLNVSPATLTRQLAREGHSLRALGNEVRQERACAMLRDTGQPITQIAYRLGYGDVANFSHAFRAATGRSPRAWRTLGDKAPPRVRP